MRRGPEGANIGTRIGYGICVVSMAMEIVSISWMVFLIENPIDPWI